MCQQLLQFCTGSTKALLFAGSLLTLALAVALGFIGCTNHALFKDINESVADSRSLSYHLHLASAGYLFFITLLACYAAQFDQKHVIRALAILTAVNAVLSLSAIAMNPSAQEIQGLFKGELELLARNYDFKDKYPPAKNSSSQPDNEGLESRSTPIVMNSTSLTPRAKRDDSANKNATKIWDALQSRGCCGLNNSTDWDKEQKGRLPKSCCSKYVNENSEQICKSADDAHQNGCLTLIGSISLHELIVLALIALVNLYLAVVSGISAYRTFHYNEASQTAYN